MYDSVIDINSDSRLKVAITVTPKIIPKYFYDMFRV